MTTHKVPPPPPDADLSPFEVGAFLAGHVPEYAVHLVQVGGTTQAERIEQHRRYLKPEGFAEWLETEDAKRTEIDPVRLVEYPGLGGSMTSAQSVESFAEIEKPPEIQAAHLEAVKVMRKAKATTAGKIATLPKARSARSEKASEIFEDYLRLALEIIEGRKTKKPSLHELAGLVEAAFPLQDGWKEGDERPTRKAISHQLAKEKDGQLKGKIKPSQNRSPD